LNLAEASIAAGEPREAESLIAEAERRGISGGSAHRIVRAKLLAKLGQSEEAAGLYAGVLSEMKSECGTEHPSLIRFLREFAEVKRALSLPAEALELEQQARQIETKLEDYKRTRPGPHGTK
jgi:hypothetical protein